MSLNTTRGQDVFDIVSAYLEKWNLSWNSCLGICTNGAPCMIGSIKGFVSLVQRENPSVVQTHCFLHREVRVSKTIPDELNQSFNASCWNSSFHQNKTIEVSFIWENLCWYGLSAQTFDSEHWSEVALKRKGSVSCTWTAQGITCIFQNRKTWTLLWISSMWILTFKTGIFGRDICTS